MLEVFTHRSLVLDESDEVESFRDNQRLAALGESVIHLALAEILYFKKPIVRAADFEVSALGLPILLHRHLVAECGTCLKRLN